MPTTESSLLVSIGMPVRNCQATVAVAIQSIVLQSYPHWELLVIDDGSSDATLQIAQAFHDERIRCYSDGRRLGLGDRLNQAIALSAGEFFARMDGDDVAYPHRLEQQVQFLCKHLDVDLVGAQTMVFGMNGSPLGKRGGAIHHREICARPFSGMPISHPTFVGRLAWFRHWKYDPTAQGACDQDLLLRAYASSTFANLSEILLGYRENQICLRKILSYRALFSRAIIGRFRRDRLDYLFRGLAGQFVKGAVDAFAVGTGLNYRILRHRAQATTADERREWEYVWRSVQDGAR